MCIITLLHTIICPNPICVRQSDVQYFVDRSGTCTVLYTCVSVRLTTRLGPTTRPIPTNGPTNLTSSHKWADFSDVTS